MCYLFSRLIYTSFGTFLVSSTHSVLVAKSSSSETFDSYLSKSSFVINLSSPPAKALKSSVHSVIINRFNDISFEKKLSSFL